MTFPDAPRRDELEAAHRRGLAVWPGVALSFEAFQAGVLTLGIAKENLLAHPVDVFLAVGCAEGRSDAIAAFDAAYIARVAEFVGRLQLAPDLVDEVRQLVRIRMLAGDDPKIRRYSGRGSLEAWVRIVSVRTALNRLEAQRPDETSRDSAGIEALVERGGPSDELGFLRARYQESFHRALEGCLGALTARDKTLLRMSFLDGQSIDVIGQVFGAHRATVARWLVAIRKRLLSELRRELALDLRASSSEAQSLIRALAPEVRVSVARLLQGD